MFLFFEAERKRRMNELRTKAHEMAETFLKSEGDYRMGYVEAEQSNPKTKTLDKTFAGNPYEGVKMLLSVDEDLIGLYKTALGSEEFDAFCHKIYETLSGTGKIIFSGCGSSGRLCMCIEKAFRRAVRGTALSHLEDRVTTVMTGGDYALIRAVESFEDYMVLSEMQVDEIEPTENDLLIGVTATGETTSILGSAIHASKKGAYVYMVVCSDPRCMIGKMDRVDKLYLRDGVSVVYLPCGAMAVTGSTRMQSSTIEMAVIMSAFELVIARLLGEEQTKDYLCSSFENTIRYLQNESNVKMIGDYAVKEASLYREGGYVTYFSENYVFDILTDTTERAPTFATPPLRQQCKTDQPLSWAFVKNPALTNGEAWIDCLGRAARCISWHEDVYKNVGITKKVPDISVDRLMEFEIGCEPDTEREEKHGIAVWVDSKKPDNSFHNCADRYEEKTELVFELEKYPTRMDMFEHLGIKMAINTVSTSAMALFGRICGNYMSFVDMSNKKLVDRGARIISDLCDVPYEEALEELYYSALLIENGEIEIMSPAQMAIQRLGRK